MRRAALLRRLRSRVAGTSLLEVLIAMAILTLILVGILQMFSVALYVNVGASSRTLVTFKAQQVAENIKFLHYLGKEYGSAQVPTGSGIAYPITQAAVGTHQLPYLDSDLYWDYWGPQGANVIDATQAPYRLSYEIKDNTQSQTYTVIVSAMPVGSSDQAANAGTTLYGGAGTKRVQYAFSVAK